MSLRRLGTGLLMLGLFSALLAPAALAQQTESDDTNVTITGGTLNMDAIAVGDFAAVEIGNSAQTTNATMNDFSVRDFRGSGAGWNVTAQATPFAEHDGAVYVELGETLAMGSLEMLAPTATAVGDTTSPAPTVTAGIHTIDAGGAVQIASAAENQGMGEYTFAFGADSLALNIPADVVAATYRSDVTIDLVSGP